MYCIGYVFLDYVNKDALTRLNNRRKYEKYRGQYERKHSPYCMLMLDIDDFKKVNDTFGHQQGDVVLRKISAIVKSYTGRGISAFRYGGEEICMTFLKVSEKRTREIAEEIREKVQNTVSTEQMRVTISGGIGVSQAGENVFQEADKNLYQAKANGKNQIC